MKTTVYRFLLLCLLALVLPLQGIAAISAATGSSPVPSPMVQTMPVAAPCHDMPMPQMKPANSDTHCAAPHAKADIDCSQHAPCCLPVALLAASLTMPALVHATVHSGYLPRTLPVISPDTPEHPPKRFTPFLA
ncbi:hypothetical protein [Leeia oryzae]|uniref:hypothetical protein n=1 Tax=Leeia oryzae TaxID=356662 RepID=UPI00039A98B1|nr:hypothetical protein [Leeia oryzae]